MHQEHMEAQQEWTKPHIHSTVPFDANYPSVVEDPKSVTFRSTKVEWEQVSTVQTDFYVEEFMQILNYLGRNEGKWVTACCLSWREVEKHVPQVSSIGITAVNCIDNWNLRTINTIPIFTADIGDYCKHWWRQQIIQQKNRSKMGSLSN